MALKDSNREYGFSTRAIHAGQHPAPGNGAIMTPIYQTSTFAQTSPGNPINPDYEYGRSANPTRNALEQALVSIENGVRGLAFASGLAATDCLIRTLKAGDEVIAMGVLPPVSEWNKLNPYIK